MTPPLSAEKDAAAVAAKHLSEADPILARVIAQVGPCDIAPVRRVDLFRSLMRSITYQQLHGKAAETIHGRVLALMPKVDAATLLALPEEALRGAGLSRNKLAAIRDLAEKTLDGTVPKPAVVKTLSDDELVERLTAVRGIGPWTVHMLMIFYLGRPDVMPTGDYAIRKAFSLLYRKGRAVTPEAMLRHAKKWQPYRSTASWYLYRSLDTPTL